ncbi:murein hydrolase transporter LrgA [Brevundimonas sp. GN22]
MLGAIALLLVCQLAGEAIHRFTGLPLPGSVIGMGLLLVWLAIFRREQTSLTKVTGWLTAHMPLMFVPPAVGLIEEGDMIARHGLGILVALLVSTVVTIAVTASVFSWAMNRFAASGEEAGDA